MYKARSKSRTNEWGTPDELFQNLNWEFDFTLDACASKANHKVKTYFTKQDNALEKTWSGRVWINPPFERARLDVWVNKIIHEVQSENVELVVALIPNYNQLTNFLCEANASEKRIVRYHLHFHDTRNGVDVGPCKQAAAFDVNVFVFRKTKTPYLTILIDEKGNPLSLEDAQSGVRRETEMKRGTKRRLEDEKITGSDTEDSGEEYDVECLLEKRNRLGKIEYLVRWKDYDEETWIEKKDIGIPLIRNYEQRKRRFIID